MVMGQEGVAWTGGTAVGCSGLATRQRRRRPSLGQFDGEGSSGSEPMRNVVQCKAEPQRNVSQCRADGAGPSGSEPPNNGGADDSDGETAEKKTRFVWTAEMHVRFSTAVHQLGVAHAKPQAIRQLMGCEGEEDAPTRQNIKSHLQKYRQHRQHAPAHVAAGGFYGGEGAGQGSRSQFEQYQLNLLQQLELQATLQEQLLQQQRDQVNHHDHIFMILVAVVYIVAGAVTRWGNHALHAVISTLFAILYCCSSAETSNATTSCPYIYIYTYIYIYIHLLAPPPVFWPAW